MKIYIFNQKHLQFFWGGRGVERNVWSRVSLKKTRKKSTSFNERRTLIEITVICTKLGGWGEGGTGLLAACSCHDSLELITRDRRKKDIKLITKCLYTESLVSWTYSYCVCVCRLSFLVSNSTQTLLNCAVEMERGGDLILPLRQQRRAMKFTLVLTAGRFV